MRLRFLKRKIGIYEPPMKNRSKSGLDLIGRSITKKASQYRRRESINRQNQADEAATGGVPESTEFTL